MPKQDNTKGLFLEKALELFANRGYEAVKISEIADAIGCTAPALYRHYANKQELYRAIFEAGINRFDESMNKAYEGIQEPEDIMTLINSLPYEEQIEKIMCLFTEPMHKPDVRDFRKLMTLEQYNQKELADLYNKRYVDIHYEKFSEIFRVLMDKGLMVDGDPYTRAVTFVSPIIVMIDVCDRAPDREEWAKERIEKHIRDFMNIYKKDNV